MKKQTQPELLPNELLWAAGGHASDVVLTAMADGQVEILPVEVLTHVNGCAMCTRHLGNAALLSLHTGRELAVLDRVSHAEEKAAARRPFPKLAVAFALLCAVLGSLPSLVSAPSSLGNARSFATHDVPLLYSGLQTLGHKLPLGVATTYGAAALVVVMAFALVRLLPKKEVS